MAEQTPASNGAAEPRPSLRDVAEQAYDDLINQADADDAAEAEAEGSVDGEGQPRDAQGRWVAKTPGAQPGEADGSQPTQPRPEDTAPQPQPSQTQPRQGEAAEAPANWPADKRDAFAKLPRDQQDFLLERHHALESDYQRKVQANATAAQFTAALAPVFTDPVIAASLQQFGLAPLQAIQEWAGMHRIAVGPMEGRVQLLQRMAQQMGVNLNPAALAPSPPIPGLTDKDMADPAIRSFADHVGRTSTEVAQLRQELQTMRQQEAARRDEETLRVHRWGVDNFAEEKDAQGNLLHPHFDAVMPALIEMFRVNPNLDLREAYEEALWRTPSIRQTLVASEQQKREREAAAQRARQAVRSNVRGITSPVSKPQPAEGERKGLRATLESTAEEIGF